MGETMSGNVIWATDTQIKQLIDDTRQVMAEAKAVCESDAAGQDAPRTLGASGGQPLDSR
jgi:hypothetical protein